MDERITEKSEGTLSIRDRSSQYLEREQDLDLAQHLNLEPEVIIIDENKDLKCNINDEQEGEEIIDPGNFNEGGNQPSVAPISTKHQARQLRYMCKNCGRIFLERDQLSRHLDSYSCKECGQSGLNNVDGERQPRSHKAEDEKERTHFCKDCGKAFLYRNHLQRHEMTHTGIRPHICVECGTGFYRSEHLSRHLKTHIGERLHECMVCGKKLTRPEHLSRHLKTHERDRQHVCHKCGQVFQHCRELVTHVEDKHNMDHVIL